MYIRGKLYLFVLLLYMLKINLKDRDQALFSIYNLDIFAVIVVYCVKLQNKMILWKEDISSNCFKWFSQLII